MRLRPILLLPLAGALVPPAGGHVSRNMILHANLDHRSEYKDIWGYTHSDGAEYALLTTSAGTSVINISSRAAPYETGFLPGPVSSWRDVKTYSTWAYVVNETSGGIQVIDLSSPESPRVVGPGYTGFDTAHNVFVDPVPARLYTAGANVGQGGVRILDLSSPAAPVEIGNWEAAYVHDVMVQDDVLYASAYFDGEHHVLDVTAPSAIATLGVLSGYPNAYPHNAWVTPDNRFLMTTDEIAGAACRMWDLGALPQITAADLYLPDPATVPHNTHIDGSLAVISHYTLGVRVVDVGTPSALGEAGHYDTFPSADDGTTRGCWGAFPFYPNSQDLIVASDTETGLYVLELQQSGSLGGRVFHAGRSAVGVPGAEVSIEGRGARDVTRETGIYRLVEEGGSHTMRVAAFAYETALLPVTIVNGSATPLDVALLPVPGSAVQGTVTDEGGARLPGARVQILDTPLMRLANAAGTFEHPSVPAGSWTLRTGAFGSGAVEKTVNVVAGSTQVVDFRLPSALVALDFETDPSGWTVSGSAEEGRWELGDPEGTGAQPEDDHTPGGGSRAWITDPAKPPSFLAGDVDGGATVLLSPTFDLVGVPAAHFAYHRWYVSGSPVNPAVDDWVVELSTDGGKVWTAVERTAVSRPEWVEVSGAIPPWAPQVVFRFTAQDTGLASTTEAGIDDFTIFTIENAASPVPAAPPGLRVAAAWPNPFPGGGQTSFALTLPVGGPVRAVVHDVAGRQVVRLADGHLAAGTHRLRWDGRTERGTAAAAGTYFLKVETASGGRSRKVTVIR